MKKIALILCLCSCGVAQAGGVAADNAVQNKKPVSSAPHKVRILKNNKKVKKAIPARKKMPKPKVQGIK